MASIADLHHALERVQAATLPELAALLRITRDETRRLLDQPAALEFVRHTRRRVGGYRILEYKRPSQPITVDEIPDPNELPIPDPTDPFKGLSAEQEIRVANIMAALAKLNFPGDTPLHTRHLAYARSLPHVKAGIRKRVPQSQHQRDLDRLGSGMWAVIVRNDLRRAGMMPR